MLRGELRGAKQDARAESNAGAVAESKACTPQGVLKRLLYPWGTYFSRQSRGAFSSENGHSSRGIELVLWPKEDIEY